ncbi:MAG: lamin tail domain-containing protein [Planctomycetes bacterium]|nr:lamin tail domain-containing protein [Planctomycetota bacterium]
MPRIPFCIVAFALAAPLAAQVRISQIYGGGGSVGAPLLSDFIELHNAGGPQDLTGWSVQYASATGSTWSSTPLPSIVLGAGEYLLIKELDGTSLPSGQVPALPAPDVAGAIGLSSTDGKVALCSALAPLAGAQPTHASIVDFVGYGQAASWREPFVGGSNADNAASPGAALALQRGVCGAGDLDDNAGDFALGLPLPRSRALGASAGLAVRAQCLPHFAKPGQSVLLIAEASDCTGARSSSATTMTADATAIGGSSALQLRDDGVAPDELAGDGLHSALLTVAAGTTAVTKSIRVVAADGAQGGAAHAVVLVKQSSTPSNDDCARATLLSGTFPLSASATFSGATAEWSPVLHASSFIETMGSRRGLWYRVTGTGHTLTADTCASPLIDGAQIPDTVVMVLGGSASGLTQVAFDDDQPTLCGVGSGVERRSAASWCSQAGATYFVWVAPFNASPASSAFTLTISDDGQPCSQATSVSVCAPHASPASEFELEPALGPALDDGCDARVARFHEVAPSFPAAVVHGHARSLATARDIDWFRFRAAASDDLSVALQAAFAAQLELYALDSGGGCSAPTLLAQTLSGARCGPLGFQSPVIAGAWYGVRVVPLSAESSAVLGGIAPGAWSSAYRLELQLGDVPSNDDCAAAIDLPCGATLTGTTQGATLEASNVPIGCIGPGEGTSGSFALSGPGVWYRVVVPGVAGVDDRSVFVETSNTSFDTRLFVFSGACGALDQVTANDDIDASLRSKVAWTAVAGQPYFVLVHGAGQSTGSFDLSASCEAAPANDACWQASPLPASGALLVGTTRGATAEPFGYPLGGVFGIASCAANGASSSSYFDVWYSLSTPCATTVRIDTCGAEDTLLSLHAACPSYFDPFSIAGACNDDGALGCTPGSELVFATSAGATYFVRVARKNGTDVGGPFSLHVTLADADGDGVDDCADGCPLDPLKLAPGVCGCGVSDVDSDGDGAADCIDGCPLDPAKIAAGVCGCGLSDVDSDGDGSADCVDGCPLDPAKLAAGVCGCGVSDVDSDGDGAADCVDGCPLDPAKLAPGVCGCGVSDIDSDGDGAADCVDGCPLDPAKLAAGVCGCGVSDVDSDGDGAADCVDGCPFDPAKLAPGVCGCGVSDIDSDNDGVADCHDNCPALANPTQSDCDGDEVGDTCEIASGSARDLDLDGLPDECEFGAVIAYCTASTTAQGCNGAMSANGVPSASGSSAFVLVAAQLDGQRNGIQFYGVSGPAAFPFGSGVLCMAAPRQRTGVRNSAGQIGQCDGSITLDWNAFVAANPNTLGAPFQPGELVWFQTWWRDPASPGGTALSAALQFTFAP